MADMRVTLTVSDTHLDRFGQVVAAATAAGLAVERRLDQLGVLVGVVEQGMLAGLRAVPGIASVEEERGLSIPPPDSQTQ